MNEEIDETEFYHQDFTTASDWEVFVARMEEIINQWRAENLKNEIELNDIWVTKSENITFVDFEFTLSYYKKSISTSVDEDEEKGNVTPINLLYDFELSDVDKNNKEACLSKWYGLNEYIILAPVQDVGINSESRIKILLSSAYIVSGNLKSQIPIFVQIREKWQRCFLGVCESDMVRTNFEMVHLRKGPQHCQYITGLISLFKSKIMSPVALDSISVSVQFSYQLKDFGNFSWKRDLFPEDINNCDFSKLPFGVTFDPISTIVFKTTWSNLPEYLIVDSENFSDFDPLHAPKWSILIKVTEEPVCLLCDTLNEFLSLGNNYGTIADLLSDCIFVPPPPDNNPLDLLTESKVPTISSILSKASRNSITSSSHKGTKPITEDILVTLLYFLFPDAEENPTNPYNLKFNEDEEISSPVVSNFDYRGFKTCPVDSLVWRLAIISAHALQSLGGSRAFVYLWYEFVKEMRYRWENCIFIPGLTYEFPDLRTCILNQKLQMLNCCVQRKKAREENFTVENEVDDDGSSSTDDEEFFDCADKPEEEKKKHKYSLWNQPKGRLSKFDTLKLIETGEYLFIPITQEPGPKTEDQLEEDTDILLKLGADEEASALRARMMSASLLSDMESFKAANPGAILEDFVRWYSPRDWIEDEGTDEWGQKKGHLSQRMMIADNIWVQMWKSSQPVPANRQKRLFDDTREAEKVLHYLESRNVSQMCEMLLPVLVQVAVHKLVEESAEVEMKVELPNHTDRVHHLLKIAERISRDIKVHPRRFESMVQELTQLELIISQANSIHYKFNTITPVDHALRKCLGDLVLGNEILLDKSSDMASRLQSMFGDAQKNVLFMTSGDEDPVKDNSLFSTPCEREFVMRVEAVKPATYSAKCPQFLRATISKNDFRLAGAFSEDIAFF